jgi:hypothetical protein
MASTTTPILKNTDPVVAYQAVYDALGDAYWEASTIDAKDQIHAAMEEVAGTITALDEQGLADNTAAFAALAPKIKQTNTALAALQINVTNITKRIGTAAAVTGAIAKVLALFPAA